MMFWQFLGGVVRFFILAVYWFGLWAIAHNYVFNGGQYIASRGEWIAAPPVLQGILLVILIIGGIAVSERIIRLRLGISFGQQKPVPDKNAIEPELLRLREAMALLSANELNNLRAAGGKRKNTDSRDIDPMSLLTEDDIAEMRAEMKDAMRRRYLQGLDEADSSDMSSFEALLDNREQRKRR
jgi:hypothetical protein